MSRGPVLVTGATGYVGGLLTEELAKQGVQVRCMARDPQSLRLRVRSGVEVVAGDALEAASLTEALRGAEAAYYLVHSMGAGAVFEERDRKAAANFSEAARKAGVQRIIYLGGLGDDAQALSQHLRSRQEVGRILRESGVPTLECRASIVIGPGSLSFEMIRALVERLPVMITPRWVDVAAQPIAVDDLLRYLIAGLDVPLPPGGRVLELGGADVVSYGELMRLYAQLRGLRRWMIRVPVLTPYLSSLWLGLVTPLYARVGRILIDSIRHPTVVRDGSARKLVSFEPMGAREAIARSLKAEDDGIARARWADAHVHVRGQVSAQSRFGNRILDDRRMRCDIEPKRVFDVIERIGGRNGWYAYDLLWKIRGWVDLLLGGVGMRRQRRDPVHLAVGEALDCWRVEKLDRGRLLRLSAEMRLPGRAWLEFEVVPDGGGCQVRQTALYDPVGLAGLAYWYLLYPVHVVIFSGMLKGIIRRARSASTAREENK